MLREPLFKIVDDHLGLRQAAVFGLDEGDLAERRGSEKFVAVPRIDQPFTERNLFFKHYQLDPVVVIADAKTAKRDYVRAPGMTNPL